MQTPCCRVWSCRLCPGYSILAFIAFSRSSISVLTASRLKLAPRCIGGKSTKVRAYAEITKRVTPHTLRHSFATHLLGHAKLEPTALYARVAGEPATSMAGLSFEERSLSGHQPEGQVDMPTWREDALRGATLGLLISLGMVLLLGGVVYWL